MKDIIAVVGHANIESPFNIEYIPDMYHEELFKKVFNDIKLIIQEKGNVICCSGMARGIDEIFALVAIELELDLIICVPNSIKWHKNLKTNIDRDRAQAISYEEILKYKNLIKIIEVEKESNNVFNDRNSEIVNISNEIYSYHLFESIGTMDCIRKAETQDKYSGNLYNRLS